MNIEDIRKSYPQYGDMSDRQLADALHDKHYSDMPKEDFYKKIGVQSGSSGDSQAVANVKEAALGAPVNILDSLADTTRNILNTGLNAAGAVISPFGSLSNEQRDALSKNLVAKGGRPIAPVPQIPQGESVRDMAGLPQANVGDKLAQGITSAAPYSAGGEAVGLAKLG